MRKYKPFSTRAWHQHAKRPSFDSRSVDPLQVYEPLVEDLRQTHDDWAWGCCPFHDDNNPSFSVNLRTGAYRCMSSHCGARGPSLVSFVSALMDLDVREAIRYLEEHHG